MMPEILLLFWTEDELPDFIVSDGWGQVFWGTLFSFLMLFPMSIPRSINALRFSSLFGVLCSVYLSLAVFFVFYCDKDMVANPAQNFKDAELFSVSNYLYPFDFNHTSPSLSIAKLQWSSLFVPIDNFRLHVPSEHPNDLH